jgi:hypothetical protein
MDAYFFLWKTFQQENNKTDELIYYNQFLLMKDSIKTLETSHQQERHQFELALIRKNQENEALKSKETRKTIALLILLIITLAIAILLLTVLRNRKKIQRINKILAQRNDEIKVVNEALNAKNHKLESHVTTILSFSKNRNITVGNLTQATKDIVAITARALKISRVSIWIYKPDEEAIQSLACFTLASESYLPAMTLKFSDYPVYFNAIQTEKIIVAHDARHHVSTKDFTTTYFEPFKIFSLLDATFHLDGELKGLLCCEQQDEPRNWTTEDIIFVSSVADIISLAFRTAQRLEYEKHIKQQRKEIVQMNEILEDRVKQRTEELENQNKQLAEYIFINSHLLRGPLSRVLGLVNLIEYEEGAKEKQSIQHLRTAANELDAVVKKISETLNAGIPLDRTGLNEL